MSGWKLVPMVATRAMESAAEDAGLNQGVEDSDRCADINNIWEAMLTAAPSPSPSEHGELIERLRTETELLLQQAEGCAINHYSSDCEVHGLPGWIESTGQNIAQSLAALASLAAERDALAIDVAAFEKTFKENPSALWARAHTAEAERDRLREALKRWQRVVNRGIAMLDYLANDRASFAGTGTPQSVISQLQSIEAEMLASLSPAEKEGE